MTMMLIIVKVPYNFSVYIVVNDDKIGNDGDTNPVAEDVEAGKDFFNAAVSVAHLHLEARLAVLSNVVDVNN